jgi:hypothetical protein
MVNIFTCTKVPQMQEHDRTYIFVIDVDSDHVARMQGQDRPILALILVLISIIAIICKNARE